MSVLRILPFVIVGVLASNVAAAADTPRVSDVFTSGTEGYHTFRIPVLVVTASGTLLAFCEGRKTGRGDHGDIDLVLKRSTDGGKTWGPLELVYEEGGDRPITIGNPCPVVDGDAVWLPFTRNNTDVFVLRSGDDGKTWGKPKNITEAVKKGDWTWYATGPGVGIQLQRGRHKGRLVIPCDHKAKSGDRLVTYSHIIYSDDHGETWKLGSTVAPHTNECQVAELEDGTLQINMRNYWGTDGKEPGRGKRRAVALSKDGGETWGEVRFDAALVEPICQASLIRHPGADVKNGLLFSNPADASKRERLTVRLSRDGGQTWPVSKVLEEGPAAYSCLAALPDGKIACLFERGRKDPYERISLAVFTPNWLTAEEKPESQTASPKMTRIASGVSGHIHPALCLTKSGALVVIFSQSDFKDLRVSRSTEGGKTWSDPVAFPHTAKLSIYPGSLTTLRDGRVVHAWNTWYMNEKGKKSRFVQFSISDDEGKSWSDPKSLPKNPDAESIIRHPIVELGPREWLFSLSDRTAVYDPSTEKLTALGDGHVHGLVPIVRTGKGTLVSGAGLRSEDGGKTWQKVAPFPAIGTNGWRFEMIGLDNGWLLAGEVEGPGTGGERWRVVVSRDDGKSWDFAGAVELYNPGRAIGGRACPRTVPLDKDTLGTVLYDVDAKQAGGPGVFFLITPMAKLRK